ncbi:MAG: glutamate--tRNA ligase [Bacteroidota bacterium]
MNSNIRLRFAPSPTGPLHIGGVRTALFNYLFAKKNKGSFILRIEDTDQTRFVKGAEEYIMESLNWCGIKFDEGIREGGPFGPYRQSERKNIYKQYADTLINSGNAYYAFDTPEELDELRKKYESEKKLFSYDSSVRMSLNNSLTLSKESVDLYLKENKSYVIRYKIPENQQLSFSDIIRGDITVNTNTLDDKVLYKSDGMPTYHLANIVDDHLMEISHVIRGEEWLPSLPLHVLLYKAFNWNMPKFAHLPLLLKPTGNGKLSKRDGDKMGFPVFPIHWNPSDGEEARGFREDGYIPEAFINMLALLGWNPGTEQEIFSMNELIDLFSLERVGKSGSKFDPEKAKWYNHQYLQLKSDQEIAKLFILETKKNSASISFEKAEQIVRIFKERANFIHEINSQAAFLFIAPKSFDEKTVQKVWKESTSEILSDIIPIIEEAKILNKENLEEKIKNYIELKQIGFGAVMSPLRLCLVGNSSGPDLFDIMNLLGKEEVIARIQFAIWTNKNKV